MPERIAIVAAMAREILPLVRNWKRTRFPLDQRQSRLAFESESAIAVCSGVGLGQAHRAAEALVRAERPSLLISAGFAGALDTKWSVGSILRPEIVIDVGSGEHFEARGEGTLASVARILDADAKRDLSTGCAADAVDMEAAAVAAVAHTHRLPFLAIKAISDDANFPMPSFEALLNEEGEPRPIQLAWMLLRQPSLLPTLWRLRANAAIASRGLCRALADLIQQQGTTLPALEGTILETVKQDAK